jgi:hypothetical protein
MRMNIKYHFWLLLSIFTSFWLSAQTPFKLEDIRGIWVGELKQGTQRYTVRYELDIDNKKRIKGRSLIVYEVQYFGFLTVSADWKDSELIIREPEKLEEVVPFQNFQFCHKMLMLRPVWNVEKTRWELFGNWLGIDPTANCTPGFVTIYKASRA